MFDSSYAAQNSAASATLARAWADGFRLPPDVTLDVWADKNRKIARGLSPLPGDWVTDRMPHTRDILIALSPSHSCTDVTFMGSSQTSAKTEIGLNFMFGMIDLAPDSMAIGLPNHKLIKRFVKRFDKNTAEMPGLAEKLRPKSRKDADSQEMKDFPGGTYYFGSAESPSDGASISTRYVYCGEVDRFPLDVDGEGRPDELFDTRRTMYGNASKAYWESSPGLESLSVIAKRFAAGDQSYRYVPCPHCGEYQRLIWAGVKWPTDDPEKAHYVCAVNGCRIEEYDKAKFLGNDASQWRATFPERSYRHRSFQISALYCPPGLGKSWGDLAVEFVKKCNDKNSLKVFVNTRLGETYVDETEKVDWEKVKARAEPYPLRTVPTRCLLITAGVDVQKNRFEIVIIGWDRDLKRTVLDHGIIAADPANPADWAMLQAYLDRPLTSEAGPAMRVECAVIDSGYLFNEVLRFTRQYKSSRWYAGKGASQRNRPIISKPIKADVKWNGKADKYGGEFYSVGTDTVKDSLYATLQADEKRDLQDRHYRFSDKLDDEFYKQLCSEVFDPHKQRYERLPGLKAEVLDGMVYGTAAAYHTNIRIDKMTDADWVARQKLHGLGQQHTLFEAPATADSNEANEATAPSAPPPLVGVEAATALFRAEHKIFNPDDDDA